MRQNRFYSIYCKRKELRVLAAVGSLFWARKRDLKLARSNLVVDYHQRLLKIMLSCYTSGNLSVYWRLEAMITYVKTQIWFLIYSQRGTFVRRKKDLFQHGGISQVLLSSDEFCRYLSLTLWWESLGHFLQLVLIALANKSNCTNLDWELNWLLIKSVL